MEFGGAKCPVASSVTETVSRDLSCSRVTPNRFIIDPARAYRYFSTINGCLDYYRRLIRLA